MASIAIYRKTEIDPTLGGTYVQSVDDCVAALNACKDDSYFLIAESKRGSIIRIQADGRMVSHELATSGEVGYYHSLMFGVRKEPGVWVRK